MKRYKIAARFEDGRKESMVIEAVSYCEALRYAYFLWEADDFYAEEVEE